MSDIKILTLRPLPSELDPDYSLSVRNLAKLTLSVPLGIVRAYRHCYRVGTRSFDGFKPHRQPLFWFGALVVIPCSVLALVLDGVVLACRGRLLDVDYCEIAAK